MTNSFVRKFGFGGVTPCVFTIFAVSVIAGVWFTGCGDELEINETVRFEITEPADDQVELDAMPIAQVLDPVNILASQIDDGYFLDALDTRTHVWESMPKARQHILLSDIAEQIKDVPLTAENARVGDFLANRMQQFGHPDAESHAKTAILDYRTLASEEGISSVRAAQYLLEADQLVHGFKFVEGAEHERYVAEIWAYVTPAFEGCVLGGEIPICNHHPMTPKIAKDVLDLIDSRDEMPSISLLENLHGHVADDALRHYVQWQKKSFGKPMIEHADRLRARKKFQKHADLLKKFGEYPDDLHATLLSWHVSGLLFQVEITQCDRNDSYARLCERYHTRALSLAVREKMGEGTIRWITDSWRASRIQSGFYKVGLPEGGGFILLPGE